MYIGIPVMMQSRHSLMLSLLLAVGGAAAFSPAVPPLQRRALAPLPRAAVAPTAVAPMYIGQLKEPVQKALGVLTGKKVAGETVPCGDDENEECFALCDTEGCAIVGRSALMKTLKVG